MKSSQENPTMVGSDEEVETNIWKADRKEAEGDMIWMKTKWKDGIKRTSS